MPKALGQAHLRHQNPEARLSADGIPSRIGFEVNEAVPAVAVSGLEPIERPVEVVNGYEYFSQSEGAQNTRLVHGLHFPRDLRRGLAVSLARQTERFRAQMRQRMRGERVARELACGERPSAQSLASKRTQINSGNQLLIRLQNAFRRRGRGCIIAAQILDPTKSVLAQQRARVALKGFADIPGGLVQEA